MADQLVIHEVSWIDWSKIETIQNNHNVLIMTDLQGYSTNSHHISIDLMQHTDPLLLYLVGKIDVKDIYVILKY